MMRGGVFTTVVGAGLLCMLAVLPPHANAQHRTYSASERELFVVDTTITGLAPCGCVPLDDVHRGFFNPFAWALDTCGANIFPGDCNTAMYSNFATKYVWYARSGYSVLFQCPALRLPWAPFDSVLTATWRDIDTAYPRIRGAFGHLDSTIGHFVFRKEQPNDTSGPTSEVFYLVFDSYVPTDSLDAQLDRIDSVMYGYNGPIGMNSGDAVVASPSESNVEVFPNPANNWVHVRLSWDTRLGTRIVLCSVLGQEIRSAIRDTKNGSSDFYSGLSVWRTQ